jgi:hypothetical protein
LYHSAILFASFLTANAWTVKRLRLIMNWRTVIRLMFLRPWLGEEVEVLWKWMNGLTWQQWFIKHRNFGILPRHFYYISQVNLTHTSHATCIIYSTTLHYILLIWLIFWKRTFFQIVLNLGKYFLEIPNASPIVLGRRE